MRYFVTTLALLAVLGPGGAQARQEPPAAHITCGALAGTPNRIAYAAPEASACCAADPACARLLATTIIRRARGDLHT